MTLTNHTVSRVATLDELAHTENVAARAEPLVIVEPTTAWSALDLRDLWTYRELLYFLTWRDLKVRYKQTLLGVAWIIMQPLLMTLVFSVFLGVLARVPTNGVPYALVVFCGLAPWNFFSASVSTCSLSLVGNSNLITKIYFPRLLLPAASILGRLVDFSIAFGLLIVIMFFYRFALHYPLAITENIVALPFLIVLLTLLTFALGTLVAALNVKYRDVGMVLPVLIQLGMFVSPVVYPSSIVPARFRGFYFLNPIAGVIDGFRAALLGDRFNQWGLAVTTVVTGILLLTSIITFRRIESSFADLV